jgi:hypothetical protein
MNSHTSSCDHMIFVAKSSPQRKRVPRRVTDRLTVHRLVNINPGQPRTSSTAAPRKLHHHRLWFPRSESKRFSFLKQAYGIKRAIKEAGEGGGAAAPARGGEAAEATPAQGGAAARGAPACSKSRFPRCLFFSEDALRGLTESWKVGRSSRGPMTH